MLPAFTGAALPRATRARTGHAVTPTCSLPEVEKNFPAYRKNKAPVISFDGNAGFKLSMERIQAFAEVDADAPTLLDYSDPDVFVPKKPVSPSAISWPSGDGRGMELSGTKSLLTQGDIKNYGPFPDFYKRSCDG